MDSIVSACKALLYVSFSIMVIVFTYLLWTHPDANYPLAKENEDAEQQLENARLQALQEWKYDFVSDVDVDTETYPIVVLRTGYKVLRAADDRSLVGWRYDIANTSPITEYSVNINYILQDQDQFEIAEGTSTESIDPLSVRTIRGTIAINSSDAERLGRSSWSIALSPNWEIAESSTEGSRYDRLAEMDPVKFPFWVTQSLEDNSFLSFMEQWEAVDTALSESQSDGDALDIEQ